MEFNLFLADNYREFFVQPQMSTSMSLIGASGDCLLAFTPQKQIVCALLPTRQKVGVWPYGSLRKYWGGKEIFGFKAGRRSPRGEGEFIFITGQGEEIYRYLARTVRLTSMASAAAKSSKSELLDSLPPDPTRSETPVPSSDSDEGENHQPSPLNVPPKPPDMSKRLSMGPLPLPEIPTASHMATPTPSGSLAGTVVSDTSPAYSVNRSPKYRTSPKKKEASKRSQSLGAVLPLQPHAPVVGPSHSLPSANQRLPEGEDDTYSHATHNLPQTPAKMAEGPPLYHGLVRTESTRSATKPASRTSEGGVANPNPDELVYDLAYPPDNKQVRIPMNQGEYGSMGDAEDQKKELMEKKLVPPSGDGVTEEKGGKAVSGGSGKAPEGVTISGNKVVSRDSIPGQEVLGISGDNTSGQRGKVMPRGNKLSGIQVQGRVECINGRKVPSLGRRGDDEVLTDNPMYDSTENMLSPNLMGGAVGGAMAGYGRDGCHFEGNFASLGLDMTDSMILNPVYGHAPMVAQKGKASGSASATAQTGTGSKPDSPLEHSMAPNPLYGLGPVQQVGQSSKQSPTGDGTAQSSQESSGGGHGQNPASKEDIDIKAPEDGDACKSSGGCGQGEDTQLKAQYTGSIETATQNHCPRADEGVAGNKQENLNSKPQHTEETETEEKEGNSGSDKPSTEHMADKQKEDKKIGVASGSGVGVQEGHALDVKVAGDTAAGSSPQKDHIDVKDDNTVVKISPQKGEKGYSKVDKNRENSEERGTRSEDESSPPPPLPPRKYTNGSDC